MQNRAQFILSRRPVTEPGFRTLALRDAWQLSYHEALDVSYNAEHDALLLGLAWQTDDQGLDPRQELAQLPLGPDGVIPREAVMRMEARWCGRYVLIVQGWVYLDASGLLGVFYGPEGIASSLPLLAPGVQYVPSGTNTWFPGPLTPCEGIRRQLPSQLYHYPTGELAPRELLCTELPAFASEAERREVFLARFATSLRNLHERLPQHRLLIALTGGHDSRLNLAAAHRAGLEFDCFTFEHDALPVGDVELARTLCKQLGCRHTYIPRDRAAFDPARARTYDAHTGGLIREEDRNYYAGGQFEVLRTQFAPCILLRGGVWATTKEFYRSFIGNELDADALCFIYDAPEGTPERESLRAYAEWCRCSPQRSIDFCNRVYLEQRVGSWLSAIEQSLDLLDGVISIQAANSRALLSLLLSFPRAERIVKRHQDQMVADLCPELADVPFTSHAIEGKGAAAELGEKAARFLQRVRGLGLRKTVRAYAVLVRRRLAERKGGEAK